MGWNGIIHKCENLAQLAVEISRLLGGSSRELDSNAGNNLTKGKFVLVLDGIDRQREAPPTLLPALARMGEIVCSYLS